MHKAWLIATAMLQRQRHAQGMANSHCYAAETETYAQGMANSNCYAAETETYAQGMANSNCYASIKATLYKCD